MAEPSATDRRFARSRMILGALALLGAICLLLGGQGTYAYWTDAATVTGSGFSSGRLDLTVNGQQGNPTAYAATNLSLTTMVPGESVAANLSIANVGDADFTYAPTVSTGGGLGPALEVRMFVGGSETGDDNTYPRTETCAGGTPVASGAVAARLNRGASQTLCVQVTLPASTGNAYQNVTTGSVSIALLATQVIA
ncbi:TasA family protein [Nocardioides sp. GXZ039]|uniref:TasA family protein n=1 Tax=Nocardioides sp. GXZ039 TaxID=3136018 RepID=UPI0030F467AB